MSTWSRLAERNRAATARNAERVLSDTTYDRFRGPRALVGLVAAYVMSTAAIPVCWLVWGSLAGLASLAPCLVAFLLLRVAVRSQADLPDDVLDERMRAERDQVYVGAFRLVATVVLVAANVALAAVAFDTEDASITFDYESVSAVYWPLLSVFLGAPSVVLAFRMRSTGVD